MADPLVVLLHSTRFVPPDVLAYLSEFVPRGYRWRPVEQGAPCAERRAAFAECEYLFAYPGDPTAEELSLAKHLRLFQLLSAGYDWLDLEAFRRAGIVLANNDGSNAVSTAEHTVMLMLALLKQLTSHHEATARGEWLGMERTLQLRELRGRVVGLVGLGHIGLHVARLTSAFGAQVLYTRRQRASIEEEQAVNARYRGFEDLLSESDIVSLHLPLGPQTRGLIDAQALARMRPGSWLVNTARGGLVDEVALVDALRREHLAGAALDVFPEEPLRAGSPLPGLPGVILTPHIGGVTRDAWAWRMRAAWSNVARVQEGLPPGSRIA